MKINKIIISAAALLFAANVNAAGCLVPTDDPQLCETKEILYSTGEASVVGQKAVDLGSPVKVYEYLRNNSEYAVYHGARSSSLNSVLGLRGNDVDLSSSLIAMLRSQGVKARYAVADIKLKKSEVANWLGVINNDLAVSILRDQGVQNINDTDPVFVVFQHVWVEALLDYDNYRAGNSDAAAANCALAGGACKWVSLDVSFKQKQYKEQYRMLLRDLNFNYNAYYNAENTTSPDFQDGMKNKNPLEIFEEQALAYLRKNHPGVTLEDVIDSGEVIKDESGLLPASLPYEVVGLVSRYNSVEDYDLANTTTLWSKYVTANVLLAGCYTPPISGVKVTLAELSTKQFTVTVTSTPTSTSMRFRLDGTQVGGSLTISNATTINIDCGGTIYPLEIGTRMDIDLEVDAAPGDAPVSVSYNNLIVGGYYLIATGGETSNWSQVKRAYNQLLNANDQYAIVVDDAGAFGAVGTAYVDINLDGLVDAGDTPLLDHQEAQDALTGGLLHVAQSLYYTRLREESQRYSRLKGIISPVAAYLGIVSTTHEVEYLNDVPFAVTPGGLLIDLKGINLNGSWEIDQPAIYSNETFKFLGHNASSLEHEVWQEITGYDAISTMHGIQMSLSQGKKLLDVNYNLPSNTFPSSLLDLGFANTAPVDFTRNEHNMFGRLLSSWAYSGTDPAAGFNMFLPDISALPPGDTRATWFTYSAGSTNSFFSTIDSIEDQYIAAQATEGQLKVETRGVSGLSSYQVVGATATTAGFGIDSFVENGALWDFVVRETAQHPDGLINVGANVSLKLKSEIGQLQTINVNVGGFTGWNVSNAKVNSPAGFTTPVTPVQISADVWQFKIQETAQHADGVYTVNIGYVVNSGTQIGTGSFNFGFNTADPIYNGSLTFSNYDVSDDVSFTCNGVTHTGAPTPMLVELETCLNDSVSVATLDYLDANKGFDHKTQAYRSLSLNIDDYELAFIQDMRNHMYNVSTPGAWFQYILPSRFSQGPNYLFNVYIKNAYLNTDLSQSTYAIVNHSNRLVSGGGYVTAEETVDTSTSVEFNNEVFTNLNMVGVTNNDIVRTPSTIDPVSTVTGNMYHDETDIVIKGRGINYALTRTYNSDQTKTAGASNTPFSKGWTHSYNMRLTANDYGLYPNYTAIQAPENANGTTSSITYTDERGGEANYLVDDVGATWAVTPPHMNFDSLQLDTPAVGQYTLSFRNGTKYIFSGADLKVPGNTARLTRIEDAYGNQLNFAYTGNNLTSITDNSGVSGRTGLTLTYYTAGINLDKINAISDWAGRTWTYTYNANGQLSGLTNPLNESMSYTYVAGTDLLKDIVKPEDRAGVKNTMTFSYYENDQAYNYIDQLGNEESLTYDLFRKRTRITNPRGYITEHYYDENGALIKLVEPDKAIHQFENNADGLRYLKRDALGNETTYSYDSLRTLKGAATDTFGQVTREQDALGNTIDYTYGIYDQITDVKDKNNVHTVSEYYDTTDVGLLAGALPGKLYRVVMPLAIVNGASLTNVVLAEYQYNADGTVKHIEEMVDPAAPTRKRITDFTYTYSVAGFTLTRVVSGATSGGSVTTQQSYDSLWRLISETVNRRTSATDAAMIALTTSYVYDDLNRPIKVTDALGNIVETIYDANGQVSQVIKRYALAGAGDRAIHTNCTVDAAYLSHHSCVETVRTYDAFDRLKTSSNISGETVSYVYDEMGNVTKITNARGYSLHNEYDVNGRLTKVTNENGYSIQTKYDLAGRVISTIDPNGNAVSFKYDKLGRNTEIISAEGRITKIDQYDGNGNVIKMRDANAVAGTQPVNTQGATVYKVYDEFNRVVSETNANNETTTYTYDLLGNLTSITDAINQTTQFKYDDLGRLSQVIDPVIEAPTDNVQSYTYDEVGNRLTVADRNGDIVRTTYDRGSRVIAVDFLTDLTTQTATYNQYGEMSSIANESVTYNYNYDNQHRMVNKVDSRTGKQLSWTYDKSGNVITKTDYQGKVTTFTYDDTSRLVAMVNPEYLQASYHYDAAGRLLSRILSNGVTTLYNYDKDGFVKAITQRNAKGVVVDERTYILDSIGNINSIAVAGGATTVYAYDPVYRLLSVDSTNNAHDQSYSYDAVGNRISMVQNATTYLYNYGLGNRLNSISSAGSTVNSYLYDANGSRINKLDSLGAVVESYVYNQKRLITQQTTGANVIYFEYDPNDFRIQKTSASATRNYLLEGEHLEATYDESNQLQASYLRGVVVDEIINGYERDANGKLINQSYHHDQVNSVIATTDHNGATTQTKAYSPFGLDLGTTGSSSNSLAYTGRELDIESDLYYYRARYYDPLAGRFLSEDPLGFEVGINFYAYVGNNPLTHNDPSGKVDEIHGIGTNNVTFENLDQPGHFVFIDTGNGLVPWNNSDGVHPVPNTISSITNEFVGANLLENHKDLMVQMNNGAGFIGSVANAAEFSPQGQPWDMKPGLDANSVYLYDGLAISYDVFGNIGWGMGMDAIGIPESVSRGAAQANAIYDSFEFELFNSDFSFDHGTDQWGIGQGYNTGNGITGGSSLDTSSNIGSYWGGLGNTANGGFVLYPNKINTNMMQSVYSK